MNGQQQHLGPARRSLADRARFGGWTVRCAHPGCLESTADQAPGAYWRTDEDRAVAAAKKLGWIHVRDAHRELVWVCPLHQTWDETALRWVPVEPIRSLGR